MYIGMLAERLLRQGVAERERDLHIWLQGGGSAELLAEALKQIYDASYQSDPLCARAAVDILCALAE